MTTLARSNSHSSQLSSPTPYSSDHLKKRKRTLEHEIQALQDAQEVKSPEFDLKRGKMRARMGADARLREGIEESDFEEFEDPGSLGDDSNNEEKYQGDKHMEDESGEEGEEEEKEEEEEEEEDDEE